MQEAANRTLICSIAFIDIVGYSKRSVAEQIQIKQRFNMALAEGLKDISSTERLVLDTGDGAAVSFLGDPEDALFVALKLRDHYRAERDTLEGAQLRDEIRMGVNLGPVKLVRDINSQPNIIGDGINVAERIMSFAQPLQITVSRSYYECVSRISDDYSKLFLYEGSKTDKHVREHEVYAVTNEQDSINALRKSAIERAMSTTQPVRDVGSATATMRIQRKKPVSWPLVIGLGALVTLGAIGGYMALKPRLPPLVVAGPAPAPTPAPAPAPAPAPQENSDGKQDTKSETKSGKDAKLDPKLDLKSDPKIVKKDPAAQNGSASNGPVPAKGMGVVRLQADPWGEVKINGRVMGLSPPLKRVELPPGKHRIEISNSGVPKPYVVEVDVKAGETTAIKHVFQ
jgi:class 3 adenylate cyclase